MPLGILFLLIQAALSFALGVVYFAYEAIANKSLTKFTAILVASFFATGNAALFSYLTWLAVTENDSKEDIYRIAYDISFSMASSIYLIFLYIRSSAIFKESPIKLQFIKISTGFAVILMLLPHLTLLILKIVSSDLYQTYNLVLVLIAFIGGAILVTLDIFYSFHFRQLILSKRASETMLIISRYGLYSCFLSMTEFCYLTAISFTPMCVSAYLECYSLAISIMLFNTMIMTNLKFKLEDKPVSEKAHASKFKTALRSADLKTMNY